MKNPFSMKRAALCAILAAALAAFAKVQAQDAPSAPSATPAAGQEMPGPEQMQAMVDAMSATAPEHAHLEPLIGDWTTHATWDMGGSEMTSEGEAEYAWIMGKRFVQCDMVSGPSAPWQSESMTIYGYDTRFKRYTMWGIDTMGTYSVSAHSAENGYDATTRKIVMEGTNEDPDHGTETFRWVLTIESEDRHVQEIYFNRGDGWPEKPMVRIELTRAE